MKKWICWALLALFALTFTAGCAEDREPVGAAGEAAITDNALIPNALIPNALIPNALIPNALDPASLLALTDPGQAGTLSRQLVKYAVGCGCCGSEASITVMPRCCCRLVTRSVPKYAQSPAYAGPSCE